MKLQHRCFLGNIAKFLRIPILKNICERLLLQVTVNALLIFIDISIPETIIRTIRIIVSCSIIADGFCEVLLTANLGNNLNRYTQSIFLFIFIRISFSTCFYLVFLFFFLQQITLCKSERSNSILHEPEVGWIFNFFEFFIILWIFAFSCDP